MVSLYHYTKKQHSDPRNKIANQLNFKEYIKWWLNEDKNNWFALNGQHAYICDSNNKILIDEIIKFENLSYGINKLKIKFNIEYNLPHNNATKHKPYKDLYDNELINIVYDYFKKDFEIFDYSYNI